jgi:hypothetical protein
MTPTRWIILLAVLCVAAMPTYPLLGQLAGRGQDAAGRGMASAFTMIFLFLLGGLVFGIPAVVIAKRCKTEIPTWAAVIAWLILFSPLVVLAGSLLFEMIGKNLRQRS